MLQSIINDFRLLPRRDPVRMSSLFGQGGDAAVTSSDSSMCCYATVDGVNGGEQPQCTPVDLQRRVCLDKQDVLRRLRTITRDVDEFYQLVESV